MATVNPPSRTTRTEEAQRTVHGNPEIIALRGGQALPEGYSYAIRDQPRNTRAEPSPEWCPPDTVIVSPTRRDVARTMDDGTDIDKGRATARRNLTKSANKKAQVAYARGVKESLANGRPVTLNVAEGHTDLKARWHAAAKEAAYKILDLRKEGWKDYTIFEKEKVHREIKHQYKFDPPLDPRKVDKYLAGHLRTSRGVWKAHWQKYGDAKKHHNCPEEAWESLIKWWCTEACMEESRKMAGRRSLVQNASKSGRNSLIDRMDEDVRDATMLFVVTL